MKKNIVLILAGLFLTPLLAGQALAHGAPFPHYHKAKKRHHKMKKYRSYRSKRTVVVRPARKIVIHESGPRTVVIKERPTRVVVRESRPRTVVVRKAPRSVETLSTNQLLGVGLRASTSALGGTKLGLDSNENPVMGGAGVLLKAKLDHHWGFELSLDAMSGVGDDFQQTTVPVMGSLTYNFMPESRIQPYALAGLGANLTTLEYLDGQFKYNMAEFAGQVGAGVEVFLTPTLSVQGDIRAQTVIKNLETQGQMREDCLSTAGGKTGFCDGLNSVNANDKLNLGVTAHIGANIYF
jgi:hypothetical protein